MRAALGLVLADPTFRAMALLMALMGVYNSAAFPYLSLIAIQRIGLSPSGFAMVLMLASVVSVAAAVMLGIFADQRANRRQTALWTALAGCLAAALMFVLPGPLVLILAHGILIPMAQPLFGQVFALTRLAGARHRSRLDGIQAVIRSAMSVAFLLVLLFWTLAFAWVEMSELWVYLAALLAAAGMVAVILRGWPRDGATEWEDRPSGLNLRAALAEMARPAVALRVLCMGALAATGGLYMMTVSLVFDASALRGPSDVALYVGLVAGWEVPFMLMLPRIAGRVTRAGLIALGTATYGVHLALLPFLSESPLLWFLPLFAGLGGAAVLILPISYYQDLLERRPGAATSLLAVQKLVADVFVAGVFALGMAIEGLKAVALMGTGLSLVGALALYLADRRGWLMRAA